MAEQRPVKEKKKSNKVSWIPMPQPGKFPVLVKSSFSPGTAISPVTVTVSTIPQVARILYESGIALLEEELDTSEGLDLEPADITFAGEIAIAVAAAKNGNTKLSKDIATINCAVPEPLFNIADALGDTTDQFGTLRKLENADSLAISHYVTAAACTEKLGMQSSIEEILLEAADYVAYPIDDPQILVPKEYLIKSELARCKSEIKRAFSPTTFRKSHNERWNDSMTKHLKKAENDNHFLGFIERMRLRFGQARDVETRGYLDSMTNFMLHRKYQKIRGLANRISVDILFKTTGILELKGLHKMVHAQTKRCKRSIGTLLAYVIPSRTTRELTRKGSTACLIDCQLDNTIRANAVSSVEDQTLAYVARYSVTPQPNRCVYTIEEDWNLFTNAWLLSFRIPPKLDGDSSTDN